MSRRSRFSREVQEEAVRLARSPGHTPESVGTALGVDAVTVRRWAKAVDEAADPRTRVREAEHAELLHLRRRVAALEEELAIQGKASAFLAREKGRTR